MFSPQIRTDRHGFRLVFSSVKIRVHPWLTFPSDLSSSPLSDYLYSFDIKIIDAMVYLPKSMASQLDFSKSKRLQIDGEINGIRIECGLMHDKGKFMSEFLIVGFHRDDGSVILVVPDKSIPNGAKLA